MPHSYKSLIIVYHGYPDLLPPFVLLVLIVSLAYRYIQSFYLTPKLFLDLLPLLSSVLTPLNEAFVAWRDRVQCKPQGLVSWTKAIVSRNKNQTLVLPSSSRKHMSTRDSPISSLTAFSKISSTAFSSSNCSGMKKFIMNCSVTKSCMDDGSI